jgi:hypothetical protein
VFGVPPSLRSAPKDVGPTPLMVRASAPMVSPPVRESEAAPTTVPPSVEPSAVLWKRATLAGPARVVRPS